MATRLFATKPISTILAEASEAGEHTLKRALGPINLITLGIGAIIGAGIFVLTGTAAAQFAGPAIVLSFVIAGVGCVFAGLCYSEFASMIPIAGSAYTYGYATMGELVAWIIGWALVLEYAFGAATVAVGWSGYVTSLLGSFGMKLPFNPTPSLSLSFFGHPYAAHVDIFALSAIIVITIILVVGVRESANFNSGAVIVKVSVLLIFIGLAIVFAFGHWHHMVANWHPFIPKNLGHFGEFGWSGIMRAAGVVFFAYIGFDAVSTAAQEAKNPQRDLPFGILGSLIICTILYIIVSGLLTGLKSYTTLNVAAPVADGAAAIGVQWGVWLIDLGAIAGLASVMLVMLLGQSRVLYTMSHDGLFWNWACKIHPRFRIAVYHIHSRRHLCGIPGGILSYCFFGRTGEPGDTAGVHHCLPGRVGDAHEAAGPAAAVPNALGAAGADLRHGRVAGADVVAGCAGVDRLRDLAGGGADHLLHLQPQAQQGAKGAG